MSAKPQVSAQNFFRRVKSLYTHWKDVITLFSIFLFSRPTKSFLTLMPSVSKMVKRKNLWKSKPLLSSNMPSKSNFSTLFFSLVYGFLVMSSLIHGSSSQRMVSFSSLVKSIVNIQNLALFLPDNSLLYWTFQYWKRRL